MVNHWQQNEAGRPPRRSLSLSCSISSNKGRNAAPNKPRAAVSFGLSLSPLSRSYFLVCLLSLLAVTRYSFALDQQQQQQQLQQLKQQEQQEETMPQDLPDREAVPSDESTADSLTEPAARASRGLPRAHTEIPEEAAAVAAGGEEEIRTDKSMCAWMFDTLIAHFEHPSEAPPVPPSIAAMSERGVRAPAFVTWMKRRAGREGFSEAEVDLRGCIGSLEPIPILTLQRYALISALQDSRFEPVVASEIPDLKCHVSLLHSFEPGKDVFDWVVGLHGIIISFTIKTRGTSRRYQSTYLPEVAAETGMTKHETIVSLVRKAGYTRGPVDADLMSRISLTRYKSSQTRMDYATYLSEYGRFRPGQQRN